MKSSSLNTYLQCKFHKANHYLNITDKTAKYCNKKVKHVSIHTEVCLPSTCSSKALVSLISVPLTPHSPQCFSAVDEQRVRKVYLYLNHLTSARHVTLFACHQLELLHSDAKETRNRGSQLTRCSLAAVVVLCQESMGSQWSYPISHALASSYQMFPYHHSTPPLAHIGNIHFHSEELHRVPCLHYTLSNICIWFPCSLGSL